MSETEKGKAAEKLKKMRAEGDRMVKGMFEFLDAQGGWLDFNYRFFPGESIKKVHITHGEICELPMALVKHLNNVWVKVRTLNNINIDAEQPFLEKRSRTRFTPMDVL